MGDKEAWDEMQKLMAMKPDDRDRYFANLPPDKTSSVLVDHLQAKPECPVRNDLIKRARSYYYDDFKSLCEPCPKIQLHADLLQAGYPDLAQEVLNGTYD